jgi:D-aminopeptidase
MEIGDLSFTLGVLVQTNFGCVENLRIDGLPVGQAVVELIREEAEARAKALTGQDDIGSIMIVVGTDLPVSELQLTRILRRATVGLARTGSFVGHGSGDVVIGFTTANRRGGEEVIRTVEIISDSKLETAFTAVAECVEEAIYNSMIAADTVTGFNGKDTVTVRALNEFIRGALPRSRAMAAGAI